MEPLEELLGELSKESPNELRVRELCRESPNLISESGKRLEVWIRLLLGNSSSSIVSKDAPVGNSGQSQCLEQNVLEADVRRTRSEIEIFRSLMWRDKLKEMMLDFCVTTQTQYKQGMNEIAAPFLYLNPPPASAKLTYDMYASFLFRYLERYFCLDESSFLFKAFRLFGILLKYHDPTLGNHLEDQAFLPEFYSAQWFLTLHARNLPIHLVLRLWDMLIAVDDAGFTFFIGLAILQKYRRAILASEMGCIPEVISGMTIEDESDVDAISQSAWKLYRATPRCFNRCLRLCCVPTPELGLRAAQEAQLAARAFSSEHLREHDTFMAAQTARSCVMISAQDLVSSLVHDALSPPETQYMVLDARPADAVQQYGAGALPRAVQLDPSLLGDSERLAAWMAAHAGARGCHLCLVDMPIVQATGMALWRRLLLGEGDGVGPAGIAYSNGPPGVI
jgi:hypothetical protein